LHRDYISLCADLYFSSLLCFLFLACYPLATRHANTPCLLKDNTKLSFYDAAMTKVTKKHFKRFEKPLSLFQAAKQQQQFKTPAVQPIP
jgi:hypothetical protein